MKRFFTSRVFAGLLVLAGAGGLFTVVWLLPYTMRDYDGEWLSQHSLQARWEHRQDRIRRLGWQHDDFGYVGRYGDERWADWIMQHLTEKGDPRACAAGHRLQALESIVNYSPERGQEWKKWPEVYPLWQAWWRENAHKTQREWIVDGFAAAGVTVHNPPAPEDWPALLAVLAKADLKPEQSEKNETAGRGPAYLSYNAFRCLRDSGFHSVSYALNSTITPDIKAGLEAYHFRETMGDDWGRRPGKVFGENDDSGFSGFVPDSLKPSFRWGWGSVSSVAVLFGVWIWRRRKLSRHW